MSAKSFRHVSFFVLLCLLLWFLDKIVRQTFNTKVTTHKNSNKLIGNNKIKYSYDGDDDMALTDS